MAKHILDGQKGEAIACSYLEKSGYTILHKNWRYKRYEIDIIAQEFETLVFIEVKTRKNNTFGEPVDFVDDNKIKNLMAASEAYLYEKGYQGEIRFDIVSILMDNAKPQIKLFRDAFWSD